MKMQVPLNRLGLLMTAVEGASKLEELKIWWDHLNSQGRAYGYHPNAPKTYVILKDSSLEEKAREIFGNDNVNITTAGHRHLGAVIGSNEFKEQYVQEKVAKWTNDILTLSEIAKEEPQVSYTAFTTGLSQRWKFMQRTIPDTADLFKPVEAAIREHFIPAICGKQVSDIERNVLSLPCRDGGLGISNPVETADQEYNASREITTSLSDLISRQEMDISLLDKDEVKRKKKAMSVLKKEANKSKLEMITESLDEQKRRLLSASSEKGASSWLTVLPLKSLGYTLNKSEFRDALCLRFGWTIPNTPKFCGCGKDNSLDHILTCARGGYVIMRHNRLRDTTATLLGEVCRDVKTEPPLISFQRDDIQGNNSDKGRLDVSAVGLWSQYERSMCDIRVFHPKSASYMNKSLSAIHSQHEAEKKRMYNDRVLNVEKATFTPLTFATTGGFGKECNLFYNRLAELIAAKRKELYSTMVAHIRTRLRFSLLKATLVAIRGVRGKERTGEQALAEISFNMVPTAQIE